MKILLCVAVNHSLFLSVRARVALILKEPGEYPSKGNL